MVKIKCLSNETYDRMLKEFDLRSPIQKAITNCYDNDSCDAFINEEAILVYASKYVDIHWRGKSFRMSDAEFLLIEIV